MHVRCDSLRVISLGLLIASSYASAQVSPDNLWQAGDGSAPAGPLAAGERQPWVQPPVARVYTLSVPGMRDKLAQAPQEKLRPAGETVVTVPMPDGTFARFRVAESPVMAPELAAQFPEIKTYIGYGIDDPAAGARIDMTPAGFHAQVLAPSGAVYVDPYWKNDPTVYASYYHHDYHAAKQWTCLLARDGAVAAPAPLPAGAPEPMVATGPTLRTYRLVVAATGEYSAYHGGTVAGAMSAIVTSVNRVDGIYERELAIRMVLVANNSSVVYTNKGSDPYTNNNGSVMLSQNQTTLDSMIGSANYDIGHVFSTGGGGIAYLGCVCRSGLKAGGVTGSPAPVGDGYDVDYVAHEMGHQFGANHTFNSSTSNCGGGNRNASTAYEPGSGSTIMAYAGICGTDDLQPHSDPYFHSISIEEITTYVTSGNGAGCAVATSSGNSAPTISGGSSYTIPYNTPFVLTASGSDPNGDPLTYCWEQRDLGPSITVGAPDNGSSPLFRSFNPTVNPWRTFPKLSDILGNITSVGEKLPTTNRTLHFRVTARDNRLGGGGTNSSDAAVTVTTSAGPFRVAAPNTAVSWSGAQTVTWNVANTTASPVSSANVSILLSTDGGNTFPTTLLASTPNDGSEPVTLPNISTTTARIKIQPVDNVYFDISDANFTIVAQAYVAADFNKDGFVNNADFDHIRQCLSPGVTPPLPGCPDADLYSDNIVDLADFGVFQKCFSGTSAPVANCGS